jgi:hypothetical protein
MILRPWRNFGKPLWRISERPESERYNVGRRQAELRVGDLVLVRLHPQSSRSHQRSAKIDYKWSLPLVASKYVSPVTVLLANPDTGVLVRKAYISQLKMYIPARSLPSYLVFLMYDGLVLGGLSGGL